MSARPIAPPCCATLRTLARSWAITSASLSWAKRGDIPRRQPKPLADSPNFPYNSNPVETAFTRACVKLAIEDLRFHDLRHEATSRLFALG